MRFDVNVAADRTVVMRNGTGDERGEQYRLFLHDKADYDRTDQFRDPRHLELAYAEVWVPYGEGGLGDLEQLAHDFYVLARKFERGMA